jgi:nitroimidazol reductase NimA-like FMN-containing flavoprotein (pyridoxamine 5'-phosphate oxidase superfamily)
VAVARINATRIAKLLDGPHQGVLSVSRRDKGPVAVPMSYLFRDGRFYMVTSPESLHGRLMQRTGRATLTVQFEACDGRNVYQWYVMAEGTIGFTDSEPGPYVRAILAKDRGEVYADEWTSGDPPANVCLAVLEPEKLSGFEFQDSLDEEPTVK